MRIVLDTNVLLVSLPSKSIYRPIFEAFLQSKFQLIITTDIYFEYQEILSIKLNKIITDIFDEVIKTSENVVVASVHFKWNIIKVDVDDNKFLDAAFAADADYLVTNDLHFNVAKNSSFPIVKIISADEFLMLLESL